MHSHTQNPQGCRIPACDIMRPSGVVSVFCGGKTLKCCWHHIDLVCFALSFASAQLTFCIVNCDRKILGLWLKISKNQKGQLQQIIFQQFWYFPKNNLFCYLFGKVEPAKIQKCLLDGYKASNSREKETLFHDLFDIGAITFLHRASQVFSLIYESI